MSTLEEVTKSYDFELPANQIALEPSLPRDAAKLLVFDSENDSITHSKFSALPDYLAEKSLIVFNETKVLPARLPMKKETGGQVSILYIKEEQRQGKQVVVVICEKKLSPDQVLKCGESEFKVISKDGPYYSLKPLTPNFDIEELLTRKGQVPLPRYLKATPLKQDQLKTKYQSVFAKNLGSVAAPTASLHFTKELLDKIRAGGHDIAFVTLHISLGTFASLNAQNFSENKLHEESYSISRETADKIWEAKKLGRPIVAVGTTVARTLESALAGAEQQLSGKTDLFIKPGFEFRVVDHLITNFHVPRSSLMMLVAALTGREKLLSLYADAINQNYNFFSFGDGMLIR